MIVLSVDYVLKFANDNVDADDKKNHGQGTTLSNTGKDVGAIGSFPSNLNEVKVVRV